MLEAQASFLKVTTLKRENTADGKIIWIRQFFSMNFFPVAYAAWSLPARSKGISLRRRGPPAFCRSPRPPPSRLSPNLPRPESGEVRAARASPRPSCAPSYKYLLQTLWRSAEDCQEIRARCRAVGFFLPLSRKVRLCRVKGVRSR